MVSGIVLAAGLSTRSGSGNKLLFPFGEKTIIESTLDNIINAGLDEIIVVLGNESDKIRSLIDHLPVRIIFNQDYKQGLTTSIKYGIQKANGNGYLFCLADMVLIKADEYNKINSEFNERVKTDPDCICIPRYLGQNGNPVLFSSAYKDRILDHKIMTGCKELVQSNKEHICFIDMQSDHILRDVDTLEDYNNLNK